MKHEIDKVLSKEDMMLMLEMINAVITREGYKESKLAQRADVDNLIGQVKAKYDELDKVEADMIAEVGLEVIKVLTKDEALAILQKSLDALQNFVTISERMELIHKKISVTLEFMEEDESK